MATTTQDLIAGFDPTSVNSMSSAQLLQMVNAANAAADKGFIITTVDDNAGNPDVPNANGTTKFQRYIWRRVSATAVIFYGWVPTVANNVSGAGMLKWVSITLAAIPDGAVINSKIAANAVTNDKIYSVEFGKLTSVPAFVLATTVYAAGNDLAGSTVGVPVVAANAITDTKLASDAADNTKRAVSVLHIKTGTAKYTLRTNAAGTAVEWFLNYFAKLITDSGIGTKFQLARVNLAANSLEWITPSVLQQKTTQDSAVATTASTIPYDDTIPLKNEGAEYKQYTITPVSTDGYLYFEFEAMVSRSAAGAVIGSIFDVNSANANDPALAAGAVTLDAADFLRPLIIRGKVAIANVVLVAGVATISVRYGGGAAGTSLINEIATGPARKLGGSVFTSMKITESLS